MAQFKHVTDLTQSYPLAFVLPVCLIGIVIGEFSRDEFELFFGETLFILDFLLLADGHWLIIERCGSLVEFFSLFCFEPVHHLSFGVPFGDHVISAFTLLDILTGSISTVLS